MIAASTPAASMAATISSPFADCGPYNCPIHDGRPSAITYEHALPRSPVKACSDRIFVTRGRHEAMNCTGMACADRAFHCSQFH
jgi:hypothetical protein